MNDISTVVSIIVGTLTAVSTLGRWFIYKPIVRLIDERTRPVQPTSNGGLSLPDVARSVARIETKVDAVASAMDRHIEWHMERK